MTLPPFLRGLSARLLVLTVLFVMVSEVLIFVPSVARFRYNYLQAKIADAELARIPVVVLTAAGAQAAAAVPAQHVLYKPLRMETVVGVVQEHCPGGAP